MHGKKPKKWDYSLVWKARQETGYGAKRLSKILNIPEGTITKILEKFRDSGHLAQNLEPEHQEIFVPKTLLRGQTPLPVSQQSIKVFNLENPDVKFSELERDARQASFGPACVYP